MRACARLITLIVAILLLPGVVTARAAEEVDLLLVLSSDVSRSIDAPKFRLQREGYAAAIVNPRVIEAIRSGVLGKIGVSFVEWSGVGAQTIVIDWTIIHDEASAKEFSAHVIEAPRAFAERTSISGGIDFAVAQLTRSPYDAVRRTIDISGDGTNNSGRNVIGARDEALAKGVTINGLVILTENPPSYSAEHTNPLGGLDNYYRNNVVGGPGAFVMVAENFESFGQAILNKLIAEIAANPYPKQAHLRPSSASLLERPKKPMGSPMEHQTANFVRAGSLDQLRVDGRLIVHGPHRPILVIYANERVFAFDNRCPHMGFPLDRGSVEDGILTCHWHHARFDLASGCTFDLWADDVPTCPVEVRGSEVWVRPTFGYADPAAHWRQRLHDGLSHNLGLVIAKAVQGELAAGMPPADTARQIVLFGVRHGDSWGVGQTIFTALGNLLPVLPEEETYLALFHGARRVAADCEGQAPRRERAPLASRPDLATLKRWLRRWTAVRHREAAERTLLTAIVAGVSPAAIADLLLDAETDRTFAGGGHSLDFINKAFECLDLIGWEQAGEVLPTVVGQMVAARGAEESTAWRQPEDLVTLCQTTAAELPLFAAAGGRRWLDHAALAHLLLGDDAIAIMSALKARDPSGSLSH
jgi:nitrite reductase/ring-hydroxylating ferredoxin subunit